MLAVIAPAEAQVQQLVDPDFRPRVAKPVYAAAGPVVAIDQAHRNTHRIDGQYAPFAALLAADGYRVQASAEPFDAGALHGIDVLVIANARAPDDAPAFTGTEEDALRRWVERGGSLLLIADHAPLGTAARTLAAKFGVDMGLGYVAVAPPQAPRLSTQLVYEGNRLGRHPIIAGRNAGETLRKVRTFTGQSLGVPAGATALLIIPQGAVEVADTNALQALSEGKTVATRPVGGRAQAIAMPFGKGRVVITGEAGMFSAQLIRAPGKPDMRFGMSVPGYDDQQFALNVMHWLTRVI
ncbi:hypothetical protein [Sphingomonas sp. DT-204]|uniref:hypothetical protein n=1 Tax=Sphingomonas sp. DT-204 TaxID=3396166 RepID=UPI003F1BA1FD